MPGPFTTPVARSTPYDDTITQLNVDNVQTAIEALKNYAETIARFSIPCGFDGGAGVGRWLEFITNVASNVSPFILPRNAILQELALAASANATGTIQIKQNGTNIQSISLSASKKAAITGLNVPLISLDEISVQVSAGSMSRPMLYMFFVFN